MSHELRFQVLTLPNSPWTEIIRRYRNLEELGFDLVGGADHFFDWSNPPSPWFEQWTLLAAVARETTQIRLSTCVTQIPLLNPALLAHQALTVDHISDGRLELGIGTGIEGDPSLSMMGI
jgi:alkanesulfonate monooxygenase SsuD/methylene tetrahydromethanopterin reductase-like flavin-dependent oxidoreductase (luciferase family)